MFLTTERPHPSDGSYPREITERIPRRSATDVHSDPESFDPLRQLPDVEVYQEANRFLRVFLSVVSVLLTFKIFEACADFLTPDGLGSCRKRRNFGAHRSLVQSCGCGLAALGSLWFHDLHVFLNHLQGLVPRPRASVGEGQRRPAHRKGLPSGRLHYHGRSYQGERFF